MYHVMENIFVFINGILIYVELNDLVHMYIIHIFSSLITSLMWYLLNSEI